MEVVLTPRQQEVYDQIVALITSPHPPKVIVLAGSEASGKTTLRHCLSQHLSCYYLSERILQPPKPEAWNAQWWNGMFESFQLEDVLNHLPRFHPPLVLETNELPLEREGVQVFHLETAF